jgi:hypothetical protein
LYKQPRQAAVSASAFDAATLKGQGFTLTLKPGWRILPGTRKGDLVVGPTAIAEP